MSDTEQLFIVAAVWTVIAAFISRFVPNWGGRIALFAVLVGVPFWELPYGYYNFQKHCVLESKLQVLEPISAQKTICFDYPMESSVEKLLKMGFQQVEAKGADGKFKQYTKGISQSIASSGLEVPKSEYCVAFNNNLHLPWRVIRHDFLILRSKEKSVVARHSVFDWIGLWWQDGAFPLLGRGGSCRPDQVQGILNALLHGTNSN